MTRGVETILAAVEDMQSAKLEMNHDRGSAAVRAGTRLVARIGLRRGEVQIYAPDDAIGNFQQAFPSARPNATGMVFDLTDRQNESAALAAIRRRVNVEKLAWQFRVRSP